MKTVRHFFNFHQNFLIFIVVKDLTTRLLFLLIISFWEHTFWTRMQRLKNGCPFQRPLGPISIILNFPKKLMSAFTKIFFGKLRMIEKGPGGAEKGHPFLLGCCTLAKKVCSQKLKIKGKRRRFVRSFTKKNSESFDENWRNGGRFSKFGQFCATCTFDFSAT